MLKNIANTMKGLCKIGQSGDCEQPVANTIDLLSKHLLNVTGVYLFYDVFLQNRSDANIDERLKVTELVHSLTCINDISTIGEDSDYYDFYCKYLLDTKIVISGDSFNIYADHMTFENATLIAAYNDAITYFNTYKIITCLNYINSYNSIKEQPEIKNLKNHVKPSTDLPALLENLIKFYSDYHALFVFGSNRCKQEIEEEKKVRADFKNMLSDEAINKNLYIGPHRKFIRETMGDASMQNRLLLTDLSNHIAKLTALKNTGECSAESEKEGLFLEESDKYYTRFKFPGNWALFKIYKMHEFKYLCKTSSQEDEYKRLRNLFFDNNITTFGAYIKAIKSGGARKDKQQCKWIKYGKIMYNGRERVVYTWNSQKAIKVLVKAKDGSQHFRYKKL
jgi:hypothetical protein